MPSPGVAPADGNYLIARTLGASPMRRDTTRSPSGAGRLAPAGRLAAKWPHPSAITPSKLAAHSPPVG
jgi:hypothetical protein